MKAIILIVLIALLSVAIASNVRSYQLRNSNPADIRAYWTEERIRAAKPLELLSAEEAPVSDLSAREEIEEEIQQEIEQQQQQQEEEEEEDQTDANLHYVPGNRTSILYPNEDFSISQGSNHTTSKRYPFNFAAYYLTQQEYTTYPWRTVGKMYFTRDGIDYECSGTVMGRYMISTAGHCGYDPSAVDPFSRNVIFIPGYNNGNSPFGVWYGYGVHMQYDWMHHASFCRDYAFITMWRDSNGNGIGDYSGYIGYYYGGDPAAGVEWRSAGYPADPPFDGNWNYYSVAQLGTRDNCLASMGIGSAATGGSSGGPWIRNFATDPGVNSVNSYKRAGQPNAIYGPYFDGEFVNIRNTASLEVPPTL